MDNTLPMNPDGSSVWPAKKGVIPVQFGLQKATGTKTTTTTSDALYPDTLESDLGTSYPGTGSYGALSFTPPTGTTVKDITNLTANFSWLTGNNQKGSMRWQIDTSAGTFELYYGDTASSFQSGQGGGGTNMTATGDARITTPENPNTYVTWSDVINGTNGVNASDATLNVTGIDLVVDGGWAGTQKVQLSDVSINNSEYVPGKVLGSTSTTYDLGPWTSTTSPSMHIDVVQTSGQAPGTVDETSYTGVGDTGGQFHVVGGVYKYNLDTSSLPGAGTYQVFMNPGNGATTQISAGGTFSLK
jgi:hypothetical protein